MNEAQELIGLLRSRGYSYDAMAEKVPRCQTTLRKVHLGLREADDAVLDALRLLAGVAPRRPLVRDYSRFVEGARPRFGR